MDGLESVSNILLLVTRCTMQPCLMSLCFNAYLCGDKFLGGMCAFITLTNINKLPTAGVAKAPDFPTSNVQESLVPCLAKCSPTSGLYQPDGVDMVSRSSFNLHVSYYEGNVWAIRTALLCGSTSFAFSQCANLLMDLSETLTGSRISPLVCTQGLSSASVVFLCILSFCTLESFLNLSLMSDFRDV